MAATIHDIAKMTGLAPATISKYLNGGNVRPKNKEAIEKAIATLHYEVNEMARSLVTNKSRLIGVLVYDIECSFASKMLHFLGIECRKQGYGLLICDSSNDEVQESQNVHFLVSRKVDGIIVFPHSLSGSFMKPAQEAGIPIVLLDRAFTDTEYDCVCIDNRLSAAKAVRQLMENNHQKIAFIGSNEVYTGIERLKGYQDAMHSGKLHVPEEYVICGRYSFEFGYTSMKKLLELPDRPTAVLLANYDTVFGAVFAINESSFKCPQDISLIGFDDLLFTKAISPSMRMIIQPMREMCEKAVEMLFEHINSHKEALPLRITFSTKISSGDSIRQI